MATVNCYLTFNGNCEAAFSFYRSVFGGDFTYMGRYKDMPTETPVPEEDAEKILHVSLPVSTETVLMGSDSSEAFGGAVQFGNNISVSINASSESEAHQLLDSLSKGGTVTMKLEKTFWGALFGSLIDPFGIHWMINYDYDNN